MPWLFFAELKNEILKIVLIFEFNTGNENGNSKYCRFFISNGFCLLFSIFIGKMKNKNNETSMVLFFNKDYTINYQNNHVSSDWRRYKSNFFPNPPHIVLFTMIMETSESPLFRKTIFPSLSASFLLSSFNNFFFFRFLIVCSI